MRTRYENRRKYRVDNDNGDCVLIAAAEEVAELHCDGVSESLGEQALRHWRRRADGVLAVEKGFHCGSVGCAAGDSEHSAVPLTAPRAERAREIQQKTVACT